MMNALYLSNNIRDIEASAKQQLPAFTLMKRAGSAIAKHITDHIQPKSTILILAGPGNNGGDALEAASVLANDYRLIILYDKNHTYTGDAKEALSHVPSELVTFITYAQYKNLSEIKIDAVIDGLFGIGLKRPITGVLLSIVDYTNHLNCPVIAIDTPSGIDPDTGNILSNSAHKGIAVHASTTITFIGNKPGLHTGDAIDYCGNVITNDLSVPEKLFPATPFQIVSQTLLSPYFTPRASNTHKGSFGDVVVIGGHKGTAGAAILAARSALHAGAGRVFVSYEELPFAYDPVQPELMIRDQHVEISEKAAIVIGPGLGCTPEAAARLTDILNLPNALVLDADALNLIASDKAIYHQLIHRTHCAVIMTPHPLEAARLLNISVKEVQNDRIAAAQKLADIFHAYVILKGAGTVIATPNAYCSINTTGNPGLATAGTGDVLSGLCGALLAQKLPTEIVAIAAPWIHGYAADYLVNHGTGPVGLTATELFPAIRKIINELNKTPQF